MDNTFALNRVTLLKTMVFIVIICLGASCTEVVNSEYDPEKSCFTEESVKAIPWLTPILDNFGKPRGGGYRLILRKYHEQYFLVVSNVFVSSPMSYIFNCDGKNIDELGVQYDEFYDNSQFMAILEYVKPI